MTNKDKERLEELEARYKLVYKGTGEVIGKSYPGGAPITDDDRYEWTGTEAVNFENSTKTTFHRYLVLKMKTDQHFPMKYVPFMGDCINPRTGLKGYEGEWTDDDFCKYFNITDSEWKEIVETMKPYLTF